MNFILVLCYSHLQSNLFFIPTSENTEQVFASRWEIGFKCQDGRTGLLNRITKFQSWTCSAKISNVTSSCDFTTQSRWTRTAGAWISLEPHLCQTSWKKRYAGRQMILFRDSINWEHLLNVPVSNTQQRNNDFSLCSLRRRYKTEAL